MIMDFDIFFFNCASIDGDGDQLVYLYIYIYIYIHDKLEDKYSCLVCTLHLLDGNNFFVIFGLFIIGQPHILVGFKSLVHDATIAHKAIIPRYSEVKICCFNVPANVNFNHSL
jgi:hypothetical protein